MKKFSRYRDGIDGGILDDGRIRVLLLGVIFLLAFGVIIWRCIFLQLYRGKEYRKLVSRQSEKLVRIPGWRGRIYSSDNILFAGNRTTCDLYFIPAEMHRGSRKKSAAYMAECAGKLAQVIGRKEFPGSEDFSRHLRTVPGIPVLVMRDLSSRELALILEFSRNRNIRGIDFQRSHQRDYPMGDSASHLIGYARQADPARADDFKSYRYYHPDLEGKSGIEFALDSRLPNGNPGLLAFPGRSVIQVNNIGYARKELLGRREPVHGNDVVLTIDSRAQKLAEELLGDQTGSMVVIDADNGNIICAATSPRMDISRFSPRLDPQYYKELQENPEKPLINRAFQAIYPPGSSIKPLMCLAFLKAGINPDEEIHCPGESTIGNATIRCSAHRYYGDDMTMTRALQKSCNTYMIHHATNIGYLPLAEMLKSAGFGRKTGVIIPDAAGDLPSDELKRSRYKMKWNKYDTALLSIGQGIISVTPLQLAVYTAALANGGTVWKPQLVKTVLDARGNRCYTPQPEAAGNLNVAPEHLNVVREGMFQVVNSPGGSGRHGKVAGLKVYGKTGTAEINSKEGIRNITHFIAFATWEKRTYALAITIEDGRSGGRTCAPLAAEFFKSYVLPPAQNQ